MKSFFNSLQIFKLLLVLAGLALGTAAKAQSSDEVYAVPYALVGKSNQYLKGNQALRSANGVYSLLMQSDGNLCIYRDGPKFVWGTMTNGKGGTILKMQSDGNLCMYTAKNVLVWSTGTALGQSGFECGLVLHDSGELEVVSSNGDVLWNNLHGKHQ